MESAKMDATSPAHTPRDGQRRTLLHRFKTKGGRAVLYRNINCSNFTNGVMTSRGVDGSCSGRGATTHHHGLKVCLYFEEYRDVRLTITKILFEYCRDRAATHLYVYIYM